MADLRSTRVLSMCAGGALALTAGVLLEPGRILARTPGMETIEGFLASVSQPMALTGDVVDDVNAGRVDAGALAMAIGIDAPGTALDPSRASIGFGPAAIWQAIRIAEAERAERWRGREYHLKPGPRNYRGELAYGAPTRYFEDFEDDALGAEWATDSRVSFDDELSGQLGPARIGGHTLNVGVEPGRAYAVRFDVYLTAGERAAGDTSGMFTLFVDGVPMLERTFAELVEDNYKLNAFDDDFDPGSVQGVLVPFVSVAPVAEITWEYETDVALGAGGWALDNVLVERSVTNPGVVGGGGGFSNMGAPEGPGKAYPGQGAPGGFSGSVRGNPSGPGGGGGPRPRPFDIPDFIPDPPDDPGDDFFDPEPDPDPPTDDPPPLADPPTDDPPLGDPPDDDDPFDRDPPDDDLPTPGGGALLVIAGLASMRRRRRERIAG